MAIINDYRGNSVEVKIKNEILDTKFNENEIESKK